MTIPILKLRGVLLCSLPTDLTDAEALEFQAHLVEKTAQTEARGVIVDLSAVEVADSFLARVINETVSMIELIGSTAVVCGMQPTPALALVEMGRELLRIHTALNLDHAMEKLELELARRPLNSAVLGED